MVLALDQQSGNICDEGRQHRRQEQSVRPAGHVLVQLIMRVSERGARTMARLPAAERVLLPDDHDVSALRIRKRVRRIEAHSDSTS